ncbi:hypothetical protein INT46_006491 [Mucor plumbeus]|uniref:Uncharacterized protein n=1 Tax=Mucor plumbeus TaxID=97098 RepID=A0A8H7R1M2_9FUNG|nr:hypothetical protein INT46_006491 [Mucor plumbeus]
MTMEEDTDIVDLEYKNILDEEINNLLCDKWCFLNENWKTILNKYNHRTELKEIKNNSIKIAKEVLLNVLGYIPVFYFLNVLYGTREYAGPYREVEKVNNPKPFKNVTLYIDGHDGKIKYYDPDTKTKELRSHKLDGPGLRTQIVTDTNKMILFISKTDKCGNCLGSDGGYNLYINQFKEQSLNAGKDFSDKNFMYPIRKENNKDLLIDEIHYNKKFGSFRSEIEDQFSVLGSKFSRFNNNTAAMLITDIKYYNLQFRVACLLKNIWKMVEDYNIEIQPHHMLWYNNKFEFPKKEKMKKLQKEILNLNINNDEIEYNSDSEDIGMEEVPIKRKKVKKPVIFIENLNR